MSNDVFPTLAGLTWSVFKSPMFNTKVQTAVDMSELRASFAATPIYRFKNSFDVLRDDTLNDELHSLGGFFMDHYGKFDSWLFTDPDDHAVTNQLIGTGNASNLDFQLVRSFGNFTEKVSNVNTITAVTVSNTPTSNYTINSTGLITFNSAPASNAPVRWSGSYYFRCRFSADTQEYENFMRQLWNAHDIEFLGNLGTKLGTS